MGVDKNSTFDTKGGDNLTNTVLLEEEIKSSGLKKGYIASKLGISRYSLINKISNKNEFKASEIDTVCEVLNISTTKRMRIFFAQK